MKQSSARPRAYCRAAIAILALVEEASGFLPALQVVAELHPVLFHDHFADVLTCEDADLFRQTFERPDGGVVALHNRARCKQLLQDSDDLRFQPLHALAERLHDKAVTIAIDDERRQQVALPRHEAIGARAFHDLVAKCCGIANAFSEKGTVEWAALAGEHPQGNLGLAAVKRLPPGMPLAIHDAHDCSGPGTASIDHVGAIDPRMAGENAVDSALANCDSRCVHARNLSYAREIGRGKSPRSAAKQGISS